MVNRRLRFDTCQTERRFLAVDGSDCETTRYDHWQYRIDIQLGLQPLQCSGIATQAYVSTYQWTARPLAECEIFEFPNGNGVHKALQRPFHWMCVFYFKFSLVYTSMDTSRSTLCTSNPHRACGKRYRAMRSPPSPTTTASVIWI